jgi:small subunit ribosomal protein S19
LDTSQQEEQEGKRGKVEMAIIKFKFKGKTPDELETMKLEEFVALLPSAKRRSFKRGLTKEQEQFLKTLRADDKKIVRTHCRDMIILPEMLGRKIAVYNGKEFMYIDIKLEMLGHRLGEYAPTRKSIKHSAAGIGATRSTKFISVR